jgi:hypothetical protein
MHALLQDLAQQRAANATGAKDDKRDATDGTHNFRLLTSPVFLDGLSA